MKYCETRGWDDLAAKKVKFACRRTCANFLDGEIFDSCDEFKDARDDDEGLTITPRGGKQCWDSSSFEFETEYAGARDCAWVAEKESRQMKYCEGRGWDGGAIRKVKFGCKESCRKFLTPGYLGLLDDCRELTDVSDNQCISFLHHVRISAIINILTLCHDCIYLLLYSNIYYYMYILEYVDSIKCFFFRRKMSAQKKQCYCLISPSLE